jgi:DNA repair exonuclease SbcCD ATPase subunit
MALAEQQRVADARVRELEEALFRQRGIDELEARLMSEAESRAATENQWQNEREQIKAECRAEVESVTSISKRHLEEAETELRSLRTELQTTRAAHEKEMAELHARHADDLTSIAEAAQQQHEAQLRELQQKLEDAEASRQSSVKALEDAQRQTMGVAVQSAQQEEEQRQELTMARSENDALQAQLTAQSATAASRETEIVVLKQKLAAVQAELDEANRKVGSAAAALPGVGGPQLVSVSKDRVRQLGKKAPTRGRQGRGGAQSTLEAESASALAPPPVLGDTQAAPALTEAQSIAASKKNQQEAAAEAARQRRANKHAKASSAATDTAAVGQTGSDPHTGASPGAQSTPAAVPAPAIATQSGAGSAGSHSDEMKGNAVFLKMQAKIREQEAKEDARCVACSGRADRILVDAIIPTVWRTGGERTCSATILRFAVLATQRCGVAVLSS